jgi:hypothetical protein
VLEVRPEMRVPGRRIFGVGVISVLLVALAAAYVFGFLFGGTPAAVSAVRQNGGVHLTLQTVPTYGGAPDPDWVSYLAQDAGGQWQHTTVYKVPAHTLVTVTLYQYDTATGLRNNFLGQVRGTQDGTATLNGKVYSSINPDDTSHTFTIPDLGISVPLPGIDSNAKNPCAAAPCPLSAAHNTITFSFMSPAKGTYRWQCFVPCAFASYFGNGGPMQTIGWMSGWIQVV